jgi:hypothetical protein
MMNKKFANAGMMIVAVLALSPSADISSALFC